MMDMRVMVEVLDFGCEELHRFLYFLHTDKNFASED